VIVGASVLAGLAATWLVFLPWLDSWSAAHQRIQSSRAGLEQLQEQARRLSASDRQLEPALGAAVRKPLASVDATRTQLIKDLMDLHMKSGAPILNIQPQAVSPLRELPGIVRLAVQVKTTCPPLQLVKLLAGARSSATLLLVDSVVAAPATQGAGVGRGMGMGAGPGPLNVTVVWSTLAREGGLQ
jgi:hypothetical protein